jgi:hypothetical protein
VVTLERPVDQKGSCPREIMKYLGNRAELFEKNFFDLTKERQIRDHLEHLKRTQILLAGCETDVCMLQSCLGLLSLDYEVYIVEDLLFSSSPDVGSAVARMQSAGAVLVSYKTLYYELLGSVCGNGFGRDARAIWAFARGSSRLRGRMSTSRPSKHNQDKRLFIKDILLRRKLVWSLPDCSAARGG